jgi:outer membrane protein TolC
MFSRGRLILLLCTGAACAHGLEAFATPPPLPDQPSAADLGPIVGARPLPTNAPQPPAPSPTPLPPDVAAGASPKTLEVVKTSQVGTAADSDPVAPLLRKEKLAPEAELGIPNLHFNDVVMPVDLNTVLRLAGIENPQILLARQRVVTALAERQYAAAQILPSLHIGTSYDDHAGSLQQSSGNILKVDRNSYFVGFGANAIAAGTVSIPGVAWNLNVSDALFTALQARQFVEQMGFASRAMENEMLRRVAVAYMELLRAQGRRSLAILIRQDAREVARITEAWAKAGAGRDADKHRAATELGLREVDVLEAEGLVLHASTTLAELLNLDPATRLHVLEDHAVPAAIVPDPIPLPELLAIALANRPEMNERRAAIRKAFLALSGTKALPFSPNVLIGLSYGGEGGGSNLIPAAQTAATPFGRSAPRFGDSAERMDFDAVLYWTLQNCGVANLAMIRAAQSNLKIADFELLATLNTVRAQVVRAYAATHARFAEIGAAEEAVRQERQGYLLDVQAVKNNIGQHTPVELLDSLDLLARARYDYLEAIIRYNQAQIDLYVALGQPPADVLARPVPPAVVPPRDENKDMPG